MGRNAKFNDETIHNIRQSYEEGTSVKELAKQRQCSTILIYRILNRKGAYAVTPQILGTPVLDVNGNVVNVTPFQAA